MEGAAKKHLPGFFPRGREPERRRRRSPHRCGDVAAIDPGHVADGLERHRMAQKGLRYVLGRHLAFGIAVLQQ